MSHLSTEWELFLQLELKTEVRSDPIGANFAIRLSSKPPLGAGATSAEAFANQNSIGSRSVRLGRFQRPHSCQQCF